MIHGETKTECLSGQVAPGDGCYSGFRHYPRNRGACTQFFTLLLAAGEGLLLLSTEHFPFSLFKSEEPCTEGFSWDNRINAGNAFKKF